MLLVRLLMPQSFDSLHLIGSIDIHVESMESCQESPDFYSACPIVKVCLPDYHMYM